MTQQEMKSMLDWFRNSLKRKLSPTDYDLIYKDFANQLSAIVGLKVNRTFATEKDVDDFTPT